MDFSQISSAPERFFDVLFFYFFFAYSTLRVDERGQTHIFFRMTSVEIEVNEKAIFGQLVIINKEVRVYK